MKAYQIALVLLVLVGCSAVRAERYRLIVEDTLAWEDTLWVPALLPGREFDRMIRATSGRYPNPDDPSDWVLVGSREDSARFDPAPCDTLSNRMSLVDLAEFLADLIDSSPISNVDLHRMSLVDSARFLANLIDSSPIPIGVQVDSTFPYCYSMEIIFDRDQSEGALHLDDKPPGVLYDIPGYMRINDVGPGYKASGSGLGRGVLKMPRGWRRYSDSLRVAWQWKYCNWGYYDDGQDGNPILDSAVLKLYKSGWHPPMELR